ncbi:MAG: response regulator [Bradyrhizobiaceae bacterium]|nr:response regulator [Bradyrhizobiaceae bacterium]
MPDNVIEQRSPLVVIIDDDPAVLNSLKFSFEIEGFAVQTFSSPEELLSSDDVLNSGCLVIDFNLRGTDGLDLLRQLRKRQIATPAILITTHPTAALRERAAIAGVPIVEKPLFGNTLIDSVRRALDRGRPSVP